MDATASRHRRDEIADPIVTFAGRRVEGDRAEVWMVRRSHRIDPLPHIVRHSPTGFEWGFAGSGPADLALALCDAATAGRITDAATYQGVKSALVATIDADEWDLPATRVLDTIARLGEVRAHSLRNRTVRARPSDPSLGPAWRGYDEDLS